MRALLGRAAGRRAVWQVFVLAGPLASRIAACLPPAAVLDQQTAQATILINAASSLASNHLREQEALDLNIAQNRVHSSNWQHLGRFARQSAMASDDIESSHRNYSLQEELQQQHDAGYFTNPQLHQPETHLNSTAAAAAAAATSTSSGRSLASTLMSLTSWEMLLVFLLISLILISIVGNCLVCIAIFTDRRLRKLGNAFIVSLAIADLFVSCLVMTFALCNDLMDYWMFGAPFCDIWISFDIMCCTASILNLCAISLDRFIHIKDCLLYNQLMTRRVAISAVIGIWIISALVSFVPINLGWHKPNHFKTPLATPAAFLAGQGAEPPGPPPWQLISAMGNDDNERKRAFSGAQLPVLIGTRLKRQVDEMQVAFSGSEKKNYQNGEWQHAFGTAAPAARQIRGALHGRFVNKDFVPTKRRRRRSLKIAGHERPRDVSSGLEWPFQVDLARTKRAKRQREAALNYNSDKLASGGYQVESNPQDGPRPPPQIKGPRKRRQAPSEETKSSSRGGPNDGVAQTSFGATSALLDHGGQFQRHHSNAGGRPYASEAPSSTSGTGELPQCMLTLTPTYAIISSTISFYIPCLIMLGLYSKLFACARRHVRNIRAITRAPHPISSGGNTVNAVGSGFAAAATNLRQLANDNNEQSNNLPTATRTSSSFGKSGVDGDLRRTSSNSSAGPRRAAALASRARTWLKFRANQPTEAGGASLDVAPPCQASLLPNDCSNGRASSCLNVRQAAEVGGGAHEQLLPTRESASKLITGANATGGTNDKTIGGPVAPPPEVREDEPFLARGANERRVPTKSNNNNNRNCDNDLQDAAIKVTSSSLQATSKVVTNFSATTIKLNLAPRSLQNSTSLSQSQNHNNQNNNQNNQNNFQAQQQHKQQQTSQLATHKAAITLGIIMGSFLFCWVPFFCLNIIKAFYADSIPGSMFRAFTWLGYANSALNPIIYGIHNSEFRNAFNRIFFKHLTLKNGRQYLNRRFSHDLRAHPHHHHQSNRRHHQAHGGTNLTLDQNTAAQNCGNHQRRPLEGQVAAAAAANNCQVASGGQIRVLDGPTQPINTERERGVLEQLANCKRIERQQQQQQTPTPQRNLTTIHQTSEET